MRDRWFVVRTKPQAEYLTASALSDEGFETYLPCIKAVFPRRGHTDTPLFPGYIFLKIRPEIEGWPVFRPVHRVLGYLKSGDEIPSISTSGLDDLKQRVASINYLGEIPVRLRKGDAVKVINASFDSVAEVLECGGSATGRIKVLLDFMGRLIQAEVPWQQIQPINETWPDRIIGEKKSSRRTRGKGRKILVDRPTENVNN